MNQVIGDLSDVWQMVLGRVGDIAPSVFSALLLVAVGWVAGRVSSRLASSLAGRLVPALDAPATRDALSPLGIQRRLADVIGTFVFWAVFVMFVGAAAEASGLPVLATWLSQTVGLLPRILLGGLIVLGGFVLGTFTRDAIVTAADAAGLARGDLLGRAAQVAIIVAAGVAGVEQIGIDSQFLTVMLSVTIGAALGGAALAFALGSRTEVGNIVAMHYVRRRLRVGQRIALKDVKGLVREFTSTGVMLETATERVHVPGKTFSDTVTRVLTSDD